MCAPLLAYLCERMLLCTCICGHQGVSQTFTLAVHPPPLLLTFCHQPLTLYLSPLAFHLQPLTLPPPFTPDPSPSVLVPDGQVVVTDSDCLPVEALSLWACGACDQWVLPVGSSPG